MKLDSPTPGIFVAISSYEERAIPKRAGFRWHGGNCYPNCAACAAGLGRVWWTNKTEVAVQLADYATEAAKAELAGHVARVEQSHALDADVEIPVPEGLAYRPFQRAGIAYVTSRPSAIIGDEMGLGKTIQVIGAMNVTSPSSVLVVCPKSVRLNWQREIERWSVRSYRICVIDERCPLPAPDAEIVIVNYDRVRKPEVHKALMARTWDLLAIDEAHRLKNPKAKQTIAVLGSESRKGMPAIPGLVHQAARCIVLTGTPIPNRPIEMHPVLAALAPREFGNFMAYAKRYCDGHQKAAGRKLVWDFTGSSRLPELQERLRSTLMIRRLKSEVLTELPPKRREIVCLPRTKAADRVIEAELASAGEALEAQAELDMAEVSGDAAAYDRAAKRLAAVRYEFSEISAQRHAVALAKVPVVLEHLDMMLETADKVIVFAHHHDVIDQLATHFGEAAVTLTGQTEGADRQVAVDRFQNDMSVRVFIGSIGACREGITLTAASAVVFAELDWVPAAVTQAEDRAHRIGQRDSVLVQHLVFDRSLDAHMAQVLVDKQAVADAALDSSTRIVVAEHVAADAKKPERKYPECTDDERRIALAKVQFLAGRCDGAVQKDHMGFNALDSKIGKRLAALDRLTDGQVWLANKITHKYARQLAGVSL